MLREEAQLVSKDVFSQDRSCAQLIALRDGFGKGVVRAGEKNPNVMVI